MTRDIQSRAFGNTHEIVLNLVKGLDIEEVLDAAAGQGPLSARFDQEGANVVALDIDQGQFVPQNIEFVRADLNKILPLENERFDCVVCIEAYEHLRNPGVCLSEFYRVLRDDGILIISTPNITSLISRLIFLFKGEFQNFKNREDYCTYVDTGIDRHILPIPAWLLKWHLKLAGFEVVKTKYSNGGIEIRTKNKKIKIPFLPSSKIFGNTSIVMARKRVSEESE